MNQDADLTVQDILDAEPLMHISDEARERGTCSTCGQPFKDPACSTSHAIAKRDLGLL